MTSTHHDPATTHTAPIRPSQWTAQRIRALGAVTDVSTAGSIFKLSRSVAYDLARTGRFPVPVLRAGTRYRVPVAAILTALHLPIETPTPPSGDGARPT